MFSIADKTGQTITNVQETAPRRGEIRPSESVIPGTPKSLHVDLYATVNGVEQRVYGYGVGMMDRKLAERLVRAWEAKAFHRVLVLRPYAACADVKPATHFISPDEKCADYAPLGRRLNADLTRLGF